MNIQIGRKEILLGSAGVLALLVGFISWLLISQSPLSNAEVLKKGPDATADRIASILEKGDGTGFCEIFTLIGGKCNNILDSKGLGSLKRGVMPNPLDSTSIVYSFDSKKNFGYNDVNATVGLVATPIETESGKTWTYQISYQGFPNLSFALPTSLGGKSLKQNKTYDAMPGAAPDDLLIEKDVTGTLKETLNRRVYAIDDAITAKGKAYIISHIHSAAKKYYGTIYSTPFTGKFGDTLTPTGPFKIKYFFENDLDVTNGNIGPLGYNKFSAQTEVPVVSVDGPEVYSDYSSLEIHFTYKNKAWVASEIQSVGW